MSRFLITSMLALGLGLGATASGQAAVGSAGLRAALAPLDTVQPLQSKEGGLPAVRGTVRPAPQGGVGRGAFVPRGGGVAPRMGGPGFAPPSNVGVPRGFVGRPGYVGRPVGIGRPLVAGPRFVRPYRPFYRRPWFGTVIGGVALGTILTVAAVGVAPEYAPAPGLCWYWSDPSLTYGYWDYCQAPY